MIRLYDIFGVPAERKTLPNSLLVVVESGGKKSSVKAGNPTIKRKGVADYTIREIIVAPDGRTVVMIIEKLVKMSGARENGITGQSVVAGSCPAWTRNGRK